MKRMEEKSIIVAEKLFRNYKIVNKQQGWIKSLFVREYKEIEAVKDVSFEIKLGEVVGVLGPNGAGKSTVIKMLSGILVPTRGRVSVLGRDPFEARKRNAYDIGVVFGQRSQLWWDLPIKDTFKLIKKMYKISDEIYHDNLQLYNEYLDLRSIWDQPVRQLSLGQRMRAEIAISILHNPKILFLDEPTIGLDVVAKKQIREFISFLNKTKKTTVILTSHDIKDIEILCERIMIIDHGKKLIDSTLKSLQEKFNQGKTMIVRFDEMVNNIIKINNIKVKRINQGFEWAISVDESMHNYNFIISELMKFGKVSDINIVEKTVEDIIVDIYTKGLK